MQLSEIKTLARAKADEPDTTGFVPESELESFVNQGYRHVYLKIVQRFEDYFITNSTISTVSGTASYALPTDFLKIIKVEARSASSTSDNDYIRVDRLNIGNDYADVRAPLRNYLGPVFGYYLAGNNMVVRPVPDSSLTIRVWYVPSPTALSAATDVPVIPVVYHELIADYAALEIIRKSGEPIFTERRDAFNQELSHLLETIEVRDTQPEQMAIYDLDYIDKVYP